MTGKLYLIPTVLGDNAPLEVLPISVKKIIKTSTLILLRTKKQQENS